MAGLCCDSGVLPTGYTAPTHRAALFKFPPDVSPSEYNKSSIPQASAAKLHTAMGTPGMQWPSVKRMDQWNDLRGPRDLSLLTDRPSRQINTFKELPSANTLVEPADTPWTKRAAVRTVVALTSGGVIEPKKDILEIARSMVVTSLDPARKDWWARRVNSLDQLEVISTTRGLTQEEVAIRERIMRDIEEEAKKPSALAINAPAYVAPAAAVAPMVAPVVAPGAGGVAAPGGSAPAGGSQPGGPTPPGGAQPGGATPAGAAQPTPGKKARKKQQKQAAQAAQAAAQAAAATTPGAQTPPPPTGAPPSTPLAPVSFHLPGSAMQVSPGPAPQVKRISDNNFSGDPNRRAEVKLDPVENRHKLGEILKTKYGQKKPDQAAIEEWQTTLAFFNDVIPEYQPTSGRNNFPKYVMDAVNFAGTKADIFVAYLTRTDSGSSGTHWLDQYITTGILGKIAEASAEGKFFTRPNYKVV